ncbi:MAG: sigma-54-dependent Fis family transcriptional regulator [Gammaproteobacteria bacterium]|nr:sigma-54-dependent Fis family transcriptional regulator [Gammaproteobacteria bacterium]
MSKPLALVVDDEPDIRDLLTITLQRMDIETRSCGDVSAAKAQLRSREYQLCLTDMRLPDGDGLDLVEWMQAQGLPTPVAVITAHGNVETAVRALKLGAFDFISKPLDLANLRNIVANALRLSSEPPPPATRVRLLGDSPPIQKLRDMIARVARSQAPVHITGESGTGKELVARMIHELGSRSAGTFAPVNCGAIASELMESEFFGHRKGSFTGAVSDKPGLFQSADGGTLFLDEIAELPLPMQVKLLRVIQEKTVRPIGQAKEMPVDVRILSATHKNLRALVASGQFREDLFYRINVIELRVPPLRERGSDVLMLARHILERQARTNGQPAPALSASAAARLQAYPFPGNVRELENILERTSALSAGGAIEADDVQLQTVAAHTEAPDESGDLDERLESVQREAIQQALEANRYNKTAAARQLGITLRALRYRMQKLAMD